ncbi:hypothetical protein AMJ44_01305 [candidate division WOR-1 bacterium DG_54_3]|uniref:Uncharacterized protein n=1 Tax=candidate division WOR-1 bacterium DG_54_3 TaxID=1703775 RepID=A0A0S7Y5E2_UNCSA|nr:MAG: hypothetical protein AMJ44_01305 [candidate division WOR-1 bacterium DG_54_3]
MPTVLKKGKEFFLSFQFGRYTLMTIQRTNKLCKNCAAGGEKFHRSQRFCTDSLDFSLNFSPIFIEFFDIFKTGMEFAIHNALNAHTAFIADRENPIEKKGKKK